MIKKPKPHGGMHHVALFVKNFEACEKFYVDLLGMNVMWRPDNNNIYLTSGNDNLALHRASERFSPIGHQQLDHIGFFLRERSDVDEWFAYLKSENVTIKALPKDHRDNTRSFYCADPDGNTVQMIYYPMTSSPA